MVIGTGICKYPTFTKLMQDNPRKLNNDTNRSNGLDDILTNRTLRSGSLPVISPEYSSRETGLQFPKTIELPLTSRLTKSNKYLNYQNRPQSQFEFTGWDKSNKKVLGAMNIDLELEQEEDITDFVNKPRKKQSFILRNKK